MILRARGVLPVAGPFISDGAVWVEDGLIRGLGPASVVCAAASGDVIDLGRSLLLPGLVNAHCHLDYTDMAGQLLRPKSFPDWIKGLVALKSSWGYSEYAASWLHGARMLLRGGVTTVADIEAVPELLPEIWQSTPLRVLSFLELLNVRSWLSARQLVREAERTLLDLPQPEGRVGLSPHAPYTTSPELLRESASVARTHGWPLTSHLAESREEYDMFTRSRGPLHEWLATQRDVSVCGTDSPVRFYARQGLLGGDFLAVHVNYLAEGDAALLAEHRVSVVHCPRSHAYFKHQRFPLQELAAAGVNLCLGTDSLASMEGERRKAPELDLFQEMRALARSEPEVSAEAIVRMATLNGARALGQAENIGKLSPGARADIIAIPLSTRAADPWETVLAHKGPVTASMIGGHWAVAPRVVA